MDRSYTESNFTYFTNINYSNPLQVGNNKISFNLTCQDGRYTGLDLPYYSNYTTNTTQTTANITSNICRTDIVTSFEVEYCPVVAISAPNYTSSDCSGTTLTLTNLNSTGTITITVNTTEEPEEPETPTPEEEGGSGSGDDYWCGDNICWINEDANSCPLDCFKNIIITAPNIWYLEHEVNVKLRFFDENKSYSPENITFTIVPDINVTARKINESNGLFTYQFFVPLNVKLGAYTLYIESEKGAESLKFQISEEKGFSGLMQFLETYKKILYSLAVIIIIIIIGFVIYLDKHKKKKDEK